MSELIRGGQVTLHRLRMLMQIGKVLTRISLLLILVSMAYGSVSQLSYTEWRVGVAWLKKEMYRHSTQPPLVAYPTPYGEKTVTPHAMERDPYVRAVMRKFNRSWLHIQLVTMIVVGIALAGVMAYFWLHGRTIRQSKQMRGIFKVQEASLKKQLRHHNRRFKKYKPFQIAGFPYPITGRPASWSSGEQSHTLLVGSTGSGKTTMIKQLLLQLRQRQQKAIIIDVKGDFIECFYRPERGDIILNPLDARGRNWSIFQETTPLKGFGTIAKSLLPRESKGDPIWMDAARSVLAEMANLYVSEQLSMAEFADKILTSDLPTLAKLLEKSAASKMINEDIEKAALSVLMVLSTYLRPFKLYRSSTDCFSITDWVHDPLQQNFLFISSRADVKEDINPLIATQVDIAVTALRSLPVSSATPTIWFILDEIPYFDQPIPSLKDGLAMSRSAGGCFVLGTQDMSSLAKIYSRETAESIANNCKTKLFLNVASKETAQWCADTLGDGETEEWNEGLSYGAHEMRDGIQVNRNKLMRKVALPSELMMLKSGEGFIRFAGFSPSPFILRDCRIPTITQGYEEHTALLALFQKELDEAERHRRSIERRLHPIPRDEKHMAPKAKIVRELSESI